MSHDDRATEGKLFLTFDEVLVEHEHLLDAGGYGEDTGHIRSFVEDVAASGAYFDEAPGRKALQGILDYWTSELDMHAEDDDATAQGRHSIDEFNSEALRARQDEFENPFAGVAERIGSLDERSPEAIRRLIEDIAKTQKLRFQGGLLKEMVSQFSDHSEQQPGAGNPVTQQNRDDATLLEFCLWHLFEDPETRLGNKLYRPKKSRNRDERIEFFSAKIYLVRKVEALHQALREDGQAAVLDELMSMSRSKDKGDAKRLRSFPGSLTRKLSKWVRSTNLQAQEFTLYGRSVPDLAGFLAASRLAFNEDGRWRLVHPALADWDPLQEKTWAAERNNKLWSLSIVTLAVFAVTSLAWWGWQGFWTERSMEYLTKAQQLSTESMKERLTASNEGLEASNRAMWSDTSYASQVTNDAIGAVIGARAKEELGSKETLQPYPKTPCDPLPGRGPPAKCRDVTVTVNLAGTLVAAARNDSGQVTMHVFDISREFQPRALELEPPLDKDPVNLQGKNCKARALRFSEDDKIVSFECLYGPTRASKVQWIAAIIRDTESNSPLKNSGIEGLRKFIADSEGKTKHCSGGITTNTNETVRSVFVGPRTPSITRFVTIRGDGYVQAWHFNENSEPCLSRQFRSDFVRIGTQARPFALDVWDDESRAVYAIYHNKPTPVVRVYEQLKGQHPKLLTEHYPPSGVGTPIGVKFTKHAQCLKIRAKRTKENVAVDYYLILDSQRLLTVAEALESDLDDGASVNGGVLTKYQNAIDNECPPES